MLSTYHHSAPFTLESGRQLPQLDIAYHTYGRLNDDRSNVIWVMHALTANSDVADWWPHTVESGKFLDPSRYFVVCANVLGSCYGTTGPLSVNPETGQPWYSRFPDVTIRDMVAAHRLLAAHLGIDSVQCVIGSSMGGYQALEWIVSDPGFARNAVLIATGSYTHPWQAGFNETMRMAIEADGTFGSDSPCAGGAGLEAARAIGLLSYRGREAFDMTQADSVDTDRSPFAHRVHSYQRHQGKKLRDRFNAYSYHRLCTAVDSHDVGRGRCSRDEVLRSVQTRCLVISISTDLIFPPADHTDLADNIPGAKHVTIDSPFAHDGFLVEHDKIDRLIQGFLS